MIRIRYVDGTERDATYDDWPFLRSDGVDWIEADHVRIAAQSVYWLRRVPGAWRAGGASFYEQAPFEVEVADDGTQREVPVARDRIPDLLHRQVKLGAWWHG